MHDRSLLPFFVLFACNDAPELDACEALVLSECDIRDRECQEHYSDVVRCLRGDDQPTPKLEVMSEEEYRAQVGSEDGPGEPPTPVDRGFQLLLRPDWVVVRSSSVPPAVYLPELGKVVVTDTKDVRRQLQAIAQAHVDAALDIAALEQQVQSEDQYAAVLALVRGEGVFYGDAAWYKTEAETTEAFGARLVRNLYYGEEQAEAAYRARESAFGFVSMVSAFALGFGPEAVLEAWVEGGHAAVRAGYAQVAGTWQLVEGELDQPEDGVEIPTPGLPDGVDAVHVGRVGPWLLHVIAMRQHGVHPKTPIAEDMATIDLVFEGWRGDSLLIAHDRAADAVGVVFTVRLDHPEAWSPADGSRWRASADGREATLVLAETIALRDALRATVWTEPRGYAPVTGGR